MTRQKPSNEHELIEMLRPYCNFTPGARYPTGIGDDAAVRVSGKKGERLVITGDTAVENVHFSRQYMTLREVAFRAMASNLSDCAAMGALPDGALVQIVFPEQAREPANDIKELYRGFGRACRKWGFPVIGGNLSRGPCWTIAITLLGRIPAGCVPLYRTGIREGDILLVTGIPGQAAAGLAALKAWGRKKAARNCAHLIRKHIRPEPRIETGLMLARGKRVRGVIDLSDGIAKDCATLCRDNRIGAVLEIASAQIPPQMIQLSKALKVDWMEWFLNGGEDYELMFAAPASVLPAVNSAVRGVKPTRIGRFTRKVKGLWLRRENALVKADAGGWDHLH